MSHEHTADAPDRFSQQFWDERYAGEEQIWSGAANPHLVSHASDLAPGTALDVGSGEGADAIWLAGQGWQVTGLDISRVALDRAADNASNAGVDVTWQQADALTWSAGASTYDLVSAQFMHLPRPSVVRLHHELASAVAPGGTLLIVGHHPDDVSHAPEGEVFEDPRFTSAQVAATLIAGDWSTIDALTLEREWVDRDGHAAVAVDAVLRAVRRS